MRARSSAHRRGTPQRPRRRTQHEQGSRRSSCTPQAACELEARPGARDRRARSSRWKARSTTPSPRQRSSPGARVPSSSTRRTRIGSRDRRPQRSRSSSSSAGRPTVLALPYGGGGNTVAYAKGFLEAGSPALQIVPVEAADRATTMPLRSASRLRCTAPRWTRRSLARAAQSLCHRRRDRRGLEIARREERASSASRHPRRRWQGSIYRASPATRVVLVLTGHGLKDPEALDRLPGAADDPRPRSRHDGEPRRGLRLRRRRARSLERARARRRRRRQPRPDHLAVRAFARLASPDGSASRSRSAFPARAVSVRARRRSRSAWWQARPPQVAPQTRRAARPRARPRGPSRQSRRGTGGRCLPDVGGSRRADRRRCTGTPIAIVPRDVTVETQAARAALPETIPHSDAAFTVARAALLGAAVASGPLSCSPRPLDDRLHEPYRAPHAPALAAVRERPAGRGARSNALRLGPDRDRLGAARKRRAHARKS